MLTAHLMRFYTARAGGLIHPISWHFNFGLGPLLSYHSPFHKGRCIPMTTAPTTLLAALQASTMLEIDGLHAWEFSLADDLNIECMDGRERKVWRFSQAQIQAAVFDESLQSWVINDGNADHRIVCLDAFTPNDEDEGELD